MSWWKRLWGGELSDEALFEALVGAAQDPVKVRELCQAHQERVVALLPRWRVVPEAVRQDPAAVQRWGETLVAVVSTLEQLGDARGMQILGAGTDSPLARWQRHREQAFELGQGGKLEEGLLEGDLVEMRRMAFLQDESQVELTMGVLGQLLYQCGQAEKALPLLEEVLERCARAGQLEDEELYARTLVDACRYLDRGEEAARWTLRRASICERLGATQQAAQLRAHAARFPQGEPLLRVVLRSRLDDGEVSWELDQLPQVAQDVRYEAVFVRGRPTLARAATLAAHSRARGSAGDREGALSSARAGAEADPLDPDCRYLLAFQLLLAGQIEEAIPVQEEVERLAPGWFDNPAWLSLSRRMASGELPSDLVSVLHLLDDGGLDPDRQLELASRALTRTPRVAQLHLHHARALRTLGRDEDARVALRAGLEVSGEDHTAAQLALQLALLDPDPEARRHQLLEVAEGGNLLAQAFARLMLVQGAH
jgi:tetratricopeptide (TPR) repeat protein